MYRQYLAVTQKLISEHRHLPEDANNIMEMFVQKCKQKSGSLCLFLLLTALISLQYPFSLDNYKNTILNEGGQKYRRL